MNPFDYFGQIDARLRRLSAIVAGDSRASSLDELANLATGAARHMGRLACCREAADLHRDGKSTTEVIDIVTAKALRPTNPRSGMHKLCYDNGYRVEVALMRCDPETPAELV